MERKNFRALKHRLGRCKYVSVQNPDREDGRWWVAGVRETIYARNSLSPQAVERVLGTIVFGWCRRSPNEIAPSFQVMASTPGMTAIALSAALSTSHRTMPSHHAPLVRFARRFDLTEECVGDAFAGHNATPFSPAVCDWACEVPVRTGTVRIWLRH
jgi:hypothetical protein